MVPNFLKDFEAEAKREAAEAKAARGESGGGALNALAGLAPEERLEAVRSSLRDLAREVGLMDLFRGPSAQVIDSTDLEADRALMDSGMDSLSGLRALEVLEASSQRFLRHSKALLSQLQGPSPRLHDHF